MQGFQQVPNAQSIVMHLRLYDGSRQSVLQDNYAALKVRPFFLVPRPVPLPFLARPADADPCARSRIPQDVTVTERFGPSDVFVPGTIRNVLYITLVTGDFTQGRKTVGKNVEVLVTVRTARGLDIPNSLVRGSGEQPLNAFESTILYHNNNPTVRSTQSKEQRDGRRGAIQAPGAGPLNQPLFFFVRFPSSFFGC